jgi:hypothetical protein
MPSFLIYATTTGLIANTVNLPADQAPAPGAGFAYLALPAGVVPGRGDKVVNGAYVPYVPTLTDNQASKVDSAQSVFDGLIAAGFTYSGVLYQIDSESQTQIAAMSLMALGSITDPANSPWPTGFYWVAADNSPVPMDAPTTYAFGRAVAGYVSACILRLRAIKDAIAAAANQPTLAAIDVTTGYPTPTA